MWHCCPLIRPSATFSLWEKGLQAVHQAVKPATDLTDLVLSVYVKTPGQVFFPIGHIFQHDCHSFQGGVDTDHDDKAEQQRNR